MAMSDEHKEALAQGRRESKIVKDYLSVLADRRPGRPITADSLKERVRRVELKLAAEPDPLRQLELRQVRIDLEDRLASIGGGRDTEALEAAFIDVARSYSERKGISYTAWREQGIPAPVLKAAGVPRTRRA